MAGNNMAYVSIIYIYIYINKWKTYDNYLTDMISI